MTETSLNDLEIAPTSVVLQTARQLATLFGETPQFQEYEQAYLEFRQDDEAQNALQDIRQKQMDLKALIMLNAISDEDQQEMQRLQNRVNQCPSVIRYNKAQEELIAMGQAIGDLLSQATGIDFGAACKTGGCCG